MTIPPSPFLLLKHMSYRHNILWKVIFLHLKYLHKSAFRMFKYRCTTDTPDWMCLLRMKKLKTTLTFQAHWTQSQLAPLDVKGLTCNKVAYSTLLKSRPFRYHTPSAEISGAKFNQSSIAAGPLRTYGLFFLPFEHSELLNHFEPWTILLSFGLVDVVDSQLDITSHNVWLWAFITQLSS